MRITIVSDTHCYLHNVDLPPADVLIHCGDFLSGGTEWEYDKFVGTLGQINKRYEQILVIPGNHDWFVYKHEIRAREMLPFNAKLLIHEPYTLKIRDEELKVFGSPWTPEFFYWAYMYNRKDAAKFWDDIPNDTDILINHGMPYGVLDSVGQIEHYEVDHRVGCKELRKRMLEVSPKLYAGGHLHRDGGKSTKVGKTLCLNAAICDDAYNPKRKPFVVDTSDWSLV